MPNAKARILTGTGIVLGACALAGVFLFSGIPNYLLTDTGGIPVPKTPFPRDAVLAMADEFKSTLRDPYSALFSETETGYKDGKYGVCGLVNAKNAYGALAGDAFYKMEISKGQSGRYIAFLRVGRPDTISRLTDLTNAIGNHPCFGHDKMP